MNKTSCNLPSFSSAPSCGISPFQSDNQLVASRDSIVTRAARKFFERTAAIETKILKMRSLKVKYAKLSLYKFRRDDTLSSTAGRVALYFATFCTGGLLAGGLFAYDVAQNSQSKSEKKQKLCDALDQLASCVCDLRSEVFDSYTKITGKRETRPLWTKGETPSKEIKGLGLNEMYKAAVVLVKELQVEIDVLNAQAEKLAQNIGIEKKNKSSPLPSHITALVQEIDKDIGSAFEAKVIPLITDIESIKITLKKINQLALEEGDKYYTKLADAFEKNVPEMIVGMGGVESFDTESLKMGYASLHELYRRNKEKGRLEERAHQEDLHRQQVSYRLPVLDEQITDLAQESFSMSPDELSDAISIMSSLLVEDPNNIDPERYEEICQLVGREVRARAFRLTQKQKDKDLIDFSEIN